LSTSDRRRDLYFFNLGLLQSLSFVFSFNTFNIHSLMLFTKSLLQFEMIDFRNLGQADLSSCRVW
jgi:hypothetical protein